MYRLRPKPKFYTSSELACCKISLGGRTESENFLPSGSVTESTMSNGDGTWTTTWSWVSTPGFDERAGFTLCCARSATFVWDELLEFISINDGAWEYTTNAPGSGSVTVGTSELTNGVCGNRVEVYWGAASGGSFSITY